MMARLGDRIAAFFRATAPDPFVLAVLLTLVTVALAVTVGDWGEPDEPAAAEASTVVSGDAEPERPEWCDRLLQITGTWTVDEETGAQSFESVWAPASELTPDGKPRLGLWRLLTFAMQMCLILVTGYGLASSPPVAALIRAIARLPRSGAQCVALVAFAAATLALVNWGLGLIAGALLAREVGRAMEARGRAVHYPLLAAAGYVGLLVWHGGFSGSAPLTVTTQAGIDTATAGTVAAGTVAPMPLTETILSPLNFVVTGGLLVLAPLILALMHPRGSDDEPTETDDDDNDPIESAAMPRTGSPVIMMPSAFTGGAADEEDGPEPVRKPLFIWLLEDTPIISVALVALIALWAIAYYFPGAAFSIAGVDFAFGDTRADSGARTLTLNTVNLTMLALGLLLQGTPARYLRAVEEGARACAGIILQFPLYAGIIAVMVGSGLASQLAGGMVGASNESTLPILTFLSAGLVNLFVPSGGGQWAVQGPIAMEAATQSGVSPATMVMAVAYGDQLTNMLQPFWALPLLAITGVRARDIVGYTAVLMVVAGVWVAGCLFVLG